MDDRKLTDAERVVTQALNLLREHFDSFQLFATARTSCGKTMTVATGDGNYFTRIGHVREWLIKVEEQAKCEQRLEFEQRLELKEEDEDV